MKQIENIKILLVEDDSADYILFKESLKDVKKNSYLLTWASSYDTALELIKKKEHDIYFFDYLLGAKTGLDLIQESNNAGVDSPIIIFTGLRNQETDLKALELGASDYLVKGEIDGEKLDRIIRYSIEHNRMVKKLKASETKFRSIFENSHDVIYLFKQDGQIQDINKSAERLLGYTREEFLNLNASDLYENKKDWKRFINEIQQNGSCANFEAVLLDKFGNKKYCTLTANIQKLEEYNDVYYQGIIHDMTLRKKAEYNIMIAEKLTVAGKIARTLAHEVRNPLTNINLSTEQLQESIEDKSLQLYFDIIKRNSKRINDLVTELLENSKPTELEESVVPVQMIFQNILELAKDRAKLKNIKIETDFHFKDEVLLADESKLTIAFLNIMMNAIEAVEMNTGLIKISGVCKNEKYLISIEDNGCGIPAEHLAKVFEPYYTSKANGIGLGLATSQNIIHTHGGKIDVETELNKGTRFKIELNLV
jgi:PAS domain S-box-containing protein